MTSSGLPQIKKLNSEAGSITSQHAIGSYNSNPLNKMDDQSLQILSNLIDHLIVTKQSEQELFDFVITAKNKISASSFYGILKEHRIADATHKPLTKSLGGHSMSFLEIRCMLVLLREERMFVKNLKQLSVEELLQ